MRKMVLAVLAVFLVSMQAYASDFPAKEVYMKYSPSVVVVRASKESGNGSIGAGSIITKDGLVITNAHVIYNKNENKPYPRVGVYIKPQKITGSVSDDLNKYYEAEVLSYDVPLDLAVLKIKGYDVKSDLIELANPDDISTGDDVIAIGHPEQGGFWTLTYGRISTVTRDFQGVAGKDMYQTDTSVNRGNSGGPLLDRRGYMVAVNSNIARVSGDGLPITGVNFSIQSAVVKKWLDKNGYVIAYGTRPLEETKVAEAKPEVKEIKPEEKKVASIAPEKKAEEPVKTAPPAEEKKAETKPDPAKVKAEVKTPPSNDKKPEPKKTEKKFETPKRPYDYDEALKAAEKDLDDMMDEMGKKFRR